MNIRIAIDVGQKAEEGVPVDVKLVQLHETWDDDGENVIETTESEVNTYDELRSETPVKQPITLGKNGGRFFIDDGGKYKAYFTWVAPDGKERTFEEAFDIPIPPECPRCERRIKELPEGDYLCDECRFGN